MSISRIETCAALSVCFLLFPPVVRGEAPLSSETAKGIGLRKITSGANRLGWQLAAALAKESPEELSRAAPAGVVVSPYSAATALAIARDGARGNTRQELSKALGVESLPADELDSAAVALAEELQESRDDGVEIEIANSIWASSSRFEPAFERRCRSLYSATVGPVDPVRINAWVAEATRNKIMSIVPDNLSMDTAAVLANAIYLKGSWTRPFDADRTTPDKFHLTDGSTAEVPFMHQDGKYLHAECDAWQMAALPYGTTRRFRMLLILPSKESTPGRLLDQFSIPDVWPQAVGQLVVREGVICVPRFRAECFFDLKTSLMTVGVHAAFESEADFSGMIAPEQSAVRVDRVYHKLFMDVDEAGTEAAAATAVVVSPPSPAEKDTPVPPFRLVLDRPFLLAVEDERTGAVLFSGVVTNPGSK